MDIARPPKSKTGRNIGIAAGIAALVLVTWGLSQLQPAAPTAQLAMLLTDTVRRGDVVREVRGNGTLVPEEVRFITPLVNGRVERIIAQSGQTVAEGDLILEMSSPDQRIATMRAQQQVREAEQNLESLRISLQNERLNLELAVARGRAAMVAAQQLAAEADSLLKANLLAPFEAQRLRLDAEAATTAHRIAEEQLKIAVNSSESRIAVAEANVKQLQAIADNEEMRERSLIMRAPEGGVLMMQDQQLQPGQWLNSGMTVGRVVKPGRLKAVLRIPETQAKDVLIGQPAMVDTRTGGILKGRVSRKDAAAIGSTVTVDIRFDDPLPPGAVPDMNVDGTIQIDLLEDVLYTGRPVSGAATGTVGLFKFEPDGGHAVRVPVQLGRSSVNTVEIISGLQVGDRVILSDMSQYDNVDRVRVR